MQALGWMELHEQSSKSQGDQFRLDLAGKKKKYVGFLDRRIKKHFQKMRWEVHPAWIVGWGGGIEA